MYLCLCALYVHTYYTVYICMRMYMHSYIHMYVCTVHTYCIQVDEIKLVYCGEVPPVGTVHAYMYVRIICVLINVHMYMYL